MQTGYARVSTQDQDLRLQYEALRQVPCDKIYEDKASGAKASREGLKLALDVLRENDTLVVWKLDRLGRSVRDCVFHSKAATDNTAKLPPITRKLQNSLLNGTAK